MLCTISSHICKRSVISPSRKISSALLAPALATVRIVPSFGFITALYAVSAACITAFPRTVASSSSFPFIDFTKPRKICDRITPEFPLAPRREPLEIAFPSSSIVGLFSRLTSFAADIIVIVIFVPVSPSGTGKTFSSLIYSFFASRAFAPARNIFWTIPASILLILTFCSSSYTGTGWQPIYRIVEFKNRKIILHLQCVRLPQLH